jgi:predicted RNA-binding Zn-ribbon protein involved in translation (DUF1610 family)
VSNNSIDLHCPNCGVRAMEDTGDLDLDQPFNCGKCGVRVFVRDLNTRSGRSILNCDTKILGDSFEEVKEFKPSC